MRGARRREARGERPVRADGACTPRAPRRARAHAPPARAGRTRIEEADDTASQRSVEKSGSIHSSAAVSSDEVGGTTPRTRATWAPSSLQSADEHQSAPASLGDLVEKLGEKRCGPDRCLPSVW
jgi:hypothetical protein